MKYLLTIILTILLSDATFSQTFKDDYFSLNEKCKLSKVLDTYDGNDKVRAYQCKDESSADIFRVIVTTFASKITDSDSYYKTLEREYSKLGQTKFITFKGKKSLQTIENVVIEGKKCKQISVALLYKGKSITLVLVTASSNHSAIMERFKNNFSLI